MFVQERLIECMNWDKNDIRIKGLIIEIPVLQERGTGTHVGCIK